MLELLLIVSSKKKKIDSKSKNNPLNPHTPFSRGNYEL